MSHLVQVESASAATGRKPTAGSVFTIVSGKGGVGKTNLAVNMSIALARRGCRPILVDADFGLANADILLNVSPLGDLNDLVRGRRNAEELLVEGPGGVRVLCGFSAAARRARDVVVDGGACRRALTALRHVGDPVFVDCGAGLSDAVVSFALASDRLILVTTPEPTALADGYATLKHLCNRGYAGRVGVVVNLARSREEGAGVAQRLQSVAERFLGLSVEDLGSVPADRHVPDAVRARVPVSVRYPRCDASSCIADVSALLVPRTRPTPVARSVWSRVAGLFL